MGWDGISYQSDARQAHAAWGYRRPNRLTCVNNRTHHHYSTTTSHRGGKLRDKSTINRLKMYRGGKPIRNKQGKVRGGPVTPCARHSLAFAFDLHGLIGRPSTHT